MKILALESATFGCSAAVLVDGRVAAHEADFKANGATEVLVPMLARVLDRAGLKIADIERLAVTVGPGHFTGLRAGLAVARGLALATGLPVVPATTLDVVASATPATARAGKRLLVALDSKRAEPYLQMFDAQLSSLGPPLSMTPAAFAATVPAGDPVAVVGDAAVPLVDALSQAGISASLLDGALRPDAAALAILAASRQPGSGDIRPFYLHPPAIKAPASSRVGA